MSISFLNLEGSPKIDDSKWLNNCFMLTRSTMNSAAYKAMMLSPADSKFTDTRVGGNKAINMPPAYTRHADPRASGLNMKNVSGTKPAGQGEYWSMQIDDNAQLIHVQFGVPTFRGMLSFFSGASNIEAGLLARTGRVGLGWYVGKAVGFVVGLRLLPFILVGTLIKFLVNRTGSRYYNMRPAMHTYWNRVNFIANSIAVNEGLVDRYEAEEEGKVEPSSNARVGEIAKAAHLAAPELFKDDGSVDVYRIASRYQELANARRKFLETVAKQGEVQPLVNRIIEYSYVQKYSAGQRDMDELLAIHDTEYGSPAYHDGIDQMSAELASSASASAVAGAMNGDVPQPTDGQAAPVAPDNGSNSGGSTDQSVSAGGSTEATVKEDYLPMDGHIKNNGGPDPKTALERKPGWFENWWSNTSEQAKAGFDGAFSWVCFKVNATGSVSASFSNSTTTPEIKSTINGFSAQAASMRFNFSQGATGIPGLDAVTKGIKDTVMGFASGISLTGLVSLAGSSYLDIPDTWENSDASLPTESYEIHLRSPYGNTLSRYINLHIPLSMLLAGALPISTGRQTYTSPFICKLISVGRSNMDLAMIDNLNVTHGVGNLGFTRDGKPLGIDISLSFKDLNRAVHAPIDTGGSLLNPLNAMAIFDDDNNFNYYLNSLAGVSVADQVLATRRLERNARIRMLQYSSYFSTSHMTLAVTESMPGRALRSVASAASLVFPSIAPGMDKIR